MEQSEVLRRIKRRKILRRALYWGTVAVASLILWLSFKRWRLAMNLIDVTAQFNTDDKCLDYLEAMRWPNGVCCIACGSTKVSRITRESKTKNKRTRLYQCLEPQCKHQFSPTAGTIFHDSHLPLRKWFAAIALVCEAKKGLSACQMQRHLKVNYRTAWHLCHRIRGAMKEPRAMFGGTVEVDETYLGGHTDKRRKQPQNKISVVA
jgi:hypothetical protein